MRNLKAEQAALRARWMAELAEAIEGAQRVAWQLGTATHGSFEARELYARLEAARLELEALRHGARRLREEIEPWLAEQIGAADSFDVRSDD